MCECDSQLLVSPYSKSTIFRTTPLQVVRLLSENGDFLVRETTKNGKKNIVLSVAWNGHKHFMVQKTAEGKFRFEGSAFPSVAELIRSQWESGSPVTVKSGAVLQRQIPRMDWEIRCAWSLTCICVEKKLSNILIESE